LKNRRAVCPFSVSHINEVNGEMEKRVDMMRIIRTPPVARDTPLFEGELFFVSFVEKDI